MKETPDINDTLRERGEDGVRQRSDDAQLFVRFKLIRFSDLKPTTTPNYLVKGLIPRVGLIVVWGPPKCGKSFWTFDLVMHIALGWNYRGRRTRGGPVVYCAFEGADGFRTRVEAFRRQHEVSEAPFYLVPAVVNLIADHAQLIASIRAQCAKPVALVLDTLNRSLFGSESSDQDMANYVKAADAIREAFGCAVIIVHHCGVEGNRPRGHTSLTGAADAQLAVKRDANNNVVVTVEHMKDGPEGATIGSRLEHFDELGADDDGDPITSCVIVPAEPGQTKAKVPESALVAFKLLQDVLAEAGSLPPASNHIPPNTRTCSVDLWRRYCYAGMITESENPDSKQKAFVRASKALQNAGLIGVWNDQVWIAGHVGHGRT